MGNFVPLSPKASLECRVSYENLSDLDRQRIQMQNQGAANSDAKTQKPNNHLKNPSTALSIFACVFYAACAISMNFLNKAIVMDFRYPNLVLLIQMFVTLVVIEFLCFFRVIELPALSMARSHLLLPVVLLYNANVAFGLMSLGNLNIPMYNTLKRLTPVVVLATRTVMTRRSPSGQITASVLVTVAGCLVAGLGDLAFDPLGYLYAGASVLLQSSYLVLVEKTGAEKDIGSWELLRYNAILSIPFLVLTVAGTGEIYTGLPKLRSLMFDTTFLTVFFTGAVMGCMLNFSLFLCTITNSALTTTIVGVLKGVVSTVLGFFLLGGVKRPSFLNFAGIAINTFGGMWYTWVKYQDKLNKRGRDGENRPVVSAPASANGSSTSV